MFQIQIGDDDVLLPCNKCDAEKNKDTHEHEERKVLNIRVFHKGVKIKLTLKRLWRRLQKGNLKITLEEEEYKN